MVAKHLAVLALMSGFSASALAANPHCERRAAEIERQIGYAQQAGNSHRVAGLQTALSRVRTHCTDAGLVEDKKRDIAEEQEDIADILEEIREKQAEGRADKVQKLERKLARRQAKLEVLQQELVELEQR